MFLSESQLKAMNINLINNCYLDGRSIGLFPSFFNFKFNEGGAIVKINQPNNYILNYMVQEKNRCFRVPCYKIGCHSIVEKVIF